MLFYCSFDVFKIILLGQILYINGCWSGFVGISLCCIQKEEIVEIDKNDESIAKTMLSDATQIDRLQTELHDLNRKIETQSSKLSSGLC